jgi:hypothetical protein
MMRWMCTAARFRVLSLLGAFAFALLAGRPALPAVVDRIAAAVNDIGIPESEVVKAMAISPMTREPGETDAAYRSRVLEALIDEKLESEDAQRFGPAPPDAAQVEEALKRLKDRLRSQGKDPDQEFAAAGLTPEEVRASVERQLLIRGYLQERFRSVAFADEDRAREEYEKFYAAVRRAAGLSVPPFESVADEMRTRSQQRIFNEEVDRWLKELRQKARVTVYPPAAPPPQGTPKVLTHAAPTPAPKKS